MLAVPWRAPEQGAGRVPGTPSGICDVIMGWGVTKMEVSPDPDVLGGWSLKREKALGEWDEPFPKIRQFFSQQDGKGMKQLQPESRGACS